jgi:drug/metabolite transporter (DMT)-like permease
MILLLVLFSCVAASFTLAKFGLMYAPPIFFLAVRMLISGPFFLIWEGIRGKKVPTIALRDIPLLCFTAFVHIYIAFVCDLVALQQMSSFKAAFLYSFSPFIAVILSYHYFSEKVTLKKIVGLTIGFFGFLLELVVHAPQEQFSCGFFFLSRADILMLISVIASVYGWTLVRSLLRRQYTSSIINGYSMLLGGSLALITSVFQEQWYVTQWAPFIGATLSIILVSNIIVYSLYGYLLHYYTTTFISFAGMLSPAIAAVFGWLFLHEAVTITFWISTGLVSFGLFLFYAEELRQGYIKKQ